MAEDLSLVCTPMPVPLCRNSPLPTIRSMIDAGVVAQDVSAAIVRDEIDADAASEDASVPQNQQKVRVCRFFVNGANCRFGGGCRFLHSWWSGMDDLFLVKALEGHRKPIAGIALPSGPRYLFSSCIGVVKAWNCDTAQCVGTVHHRCRIGCLVGGGAWVFLGLPGAVKALNPQTGVELFLEFLGGKQVYAMVLGSVNGEELLFAGLSDGSIFAWIWDAAGNTFQQILGLRGLFLAQAHRLAIRALVVGKELLYSASMDHNIKVWDLKTLTCIQTLTGHSDAVTSIICWDKFLLSGSLDGTVRVWSANVDSFQMEMIYMHQEEASVVALSAMYDSRCRPVLMCSCDDFCVYLYELPSFVELGRIFSGDEIRRITTGPDGLFFTGNASGDLKVWKWKTGN